MKRTLKTVATVALAGFVVASCSSLNKMKRLEKNIAYKVHPEGTNPLPLPHDLMMFSPWVLPEVEEPVEG